MNVKEYIVDLIEPLNEAILDSLHSLKYEIVFQDDLVPEILVVKGTQSLESLSFVKSCRETRVDGVLLTPKLPKTTKVSFKPEFNLDPLHLFGIGFGVGVVVLDCGIFPEICGEVEEEEDFTGYGKVPYVTPNGAVSPHGSIVVSEIRQIAKAVKIYSGKVLHKDGTLNETHLLNGLKWARQQENVRIINLSVGWAYECQGDCMLARYINKIWEKQKILVVAAAGNNNEEKQHRVHCPACAEEAITVGAVSTEGDAIAQFSVQGHINTNKPNIVTTGIGGVVSDAYISRFSGTSFAAPVVTGILSCLVSYVRNVETLRMRLYETAERMEGVPSSYQGMGKLNLPALLEVLANERIDSASS